MVEGSPHWNSGLPLLIGGGSGGTVTLNVPLEGATLTSAQLIAQWTWAPSTLTTIAYRFYITDSGGVIIYDTGVVAFANQNTHVVPAGVLEHNKSYRAWVIAYFPDGGIGTDDNGFTTNFLTAANPGTIVAVPVGDKCQRLDTSVLPHIRVQWSQVNVGFGETFSSYKVYRREYGQPWVLVANLTGITNTYFRDYNVQPYTVYEYSVRVVVTFGGIYRVRTGANNPIPIIAFDHYWIHDATQNYANIQPTFLCLDSWSVNQQKVYDSKIVEVWGHRQPVAVYGEVDYSRLSFSGETRNKLNQRPWSTLDTLFEAQRNGSTMCLRMGRDKRRYFGQIVNPNYDGRDSRVYKSDFDFVETYWNEATT